MIHAEIRLEFIEHLDTTLGPSSHLELDCLCLHYCLYDKNSLVSGGTRKTCNCKRKEIGANEFGIPF
jgi:hypothetical protein